MVRGQPDYVVCMPWKTAPLLYGECLVLQCVACETLVQVSPSSPRDKPVICPLCAIDIAMAH